MNPETNKFEMLQDGSTLRNMKEIEERAEAMRREVEQLSRHNTPLDEVIAQTLIRPNGEPVPKHWTQFEAGESVVIKDYTFKVAHIGESYIVFEPVGPIVIGKKAK